ncbi:tetratricopeptide repeat protein [Lusitaniella coriacea LEGE 07157]|uniref:Tetratricopeptide repeat protein n=1 Tax=Lusitaniella coriacea LEGE 07157 TaxID=945747 RepID=A0A8J7E021_9CYAN|nr:tetratricopeptide repeat protein [Lusitaniella coriacea]MBE9116864.1 tetratricopeptide repeat protein [Lusitaniella coriacea LEGE 07157]
MQRFLPLLKKFPWLKYFLNLIRRFNFWSLDEIVNSGNILLAQGKFAEALEKYNQAIALYPNHASAYYYRGNAFAVGEQLQEATQDYQQAIALGFNEEELHFNYGKVLAQQERWDEAFEQYQQAIPLQPRWVDAFWLLGNALLNQSQFNKAAAIYKKVLTLEPERAEVYFNLANALNNQGQLEEAIENYKNAIALQPEWVDPHLYLAEAFKALGHLEQAKECFESAIALQPERADSHFNLGNILFHQGKLERAIESYQSAIALQPEWVEPHLYLAEAFKAQEQLEQAQKCFESAIALQPDKADSHFNLGNILSHQGKLNEAIESYQSAIALQPEWVDPHRCLGELFFSQSNWENAAQSWYRVLVLQPPVAETHFKLGHSLLNLGKHQKAIEQYQKVIALQPNWSVAYFYRGNALEFDGQLSKAIQDYQKAITLGLKEVDSRIDLKSALPNPEGIDRQIEQKHPRISPDLFDVFLQIGSILECQSLWEQAAQKYQLCTVLSLDAAEAHFRLGNMLEKLYYSDIESDEAMPSFERAIAHWKQAFTLKNDWLEAYYKAGDNLLIIGRKNEALAIYQKAAEVQKKLAKEKLLDKIDLRLILCIPNGIGHITLLDYYVKMGILGWRTSCRTAVLVPPDKMVNPCFLNYWSPYIKIISDPDTIQEFTPIAQYLEERINVVGFRQGQAQAVDQLIAEVEKQWHEEKRAPLLTLSDSDTHRGWNCLQKLGVPKDAWFVCLHVRESGYTGDKDRPPNNHRNADIQTYLLAIQTIVEQGGWVIRIGDPTMKPLPPMKQVIDYAHSEMKSDWMDVFLCACCHFYLGTASGPCMIPPAFGIPCALTNYNPIVARPFYFNNLYIPKLYWSIPEKRYLTFEEIWSSFLAENFHSNFYLAQGIQFIDNTSDEIKDLVLEILEQLDGKLTYTLENDSLQSQFNRLGKTHGSYGFNSRVGRAFLQKHLHLL